MDFPDFDARTFRTGLHTLFPKDGYIDVEPAAHWFNVTPKTLRNWIYEKTRTPRAVWCLVYLCSSGDLALFHPKWYGWHIFKDTIGTETRRYTAAQVESLEWFQTANARLLTIAAAWELEVKALPMNENTIKQAVDDAQNVITTALIELETRLTSKRQAKLTTCQRTAN